MMAEGVICTEMVKINSETTVGGGFTQRKIEFHLARKPSNILSSSSDFHLETLNPGVKGSSGSGGSGNKSLVLVAEHGLDLELFSGITFRRIGAGLENLGNTCFLNSVLQCLTYTQPFAAYLQSGKHKSSCHINGICAMCAIQNHVSRALQSTGRILAPKDLVMNLRCISRNFRNARQEDAHEYMVNLLESMHKCSLPSGVPSQSSGAYEKSLVHKIFGGRLRSQVKCTQCNYCSNTFDPFLDLSLEINRADSLRKALSHFTATEQLDGGEKHYQCQRCKQKVRALKQLTVDKAPYVLSVHLKRFGSHVQGQKINKNVEFGSTLDLKPYYSGPHQGDLKYTLYGVLVHAGWSTRSGHYYCFVRTSTGMWHSLDDNTVRQVGEKTVLQQKAYMLFYVRDVKSLAPKKPNNAIHRENMKDSSNRSSTSNSSSVNIVTKGLPESAPSEDKKIASPANTLAVANNGAKVHKSSFQGSSKDSGVSNAAPIICNGSLVKKEVGVVVNGKLPTGNSCTRVNSLETENAKPVAPSPQAEDKNNLGKSSKDKLFLKQTEIHPKAKENGSVELASQLAKDPKTSLALKHRQQNLKPKKKLMKSRSMGLHLGSKLMQKASKKNKLKKKSKKTSEVDLNSVQSRKQKDNSSSINGSKLEKMVKDCNGDSKVAKGGEIISERVGVNGAVLATEKSSKQTSILSHEATKCDAREPDSSHEKTSNKAEELMNVLTRGLDHFTVPRWGDNAGPRSSHVPVFEPAKAIGYVPDEWDEAYDQGKRKKIREKKDVFGGPNLFQQQYTSTNGHPNKKARRMDKNSSANQPFRISGNNL